MVSGDSANVSAATTMPPLPAKRVNETSGRTGRTTGRPATAAPSKKIGTSGIGRYTRIG